MTYTVKEIFYTLQGEGANTGRPAVFCRFAGCNLWSGREQDRFKAVCQFCDTDFRGTDGKNGGEYRTAAELADRIKATWPRGSDERLPFFVVCTGGEPLLQLDENLVNELHVRGFEVAVEINGTKVAPSGLDWICVSPKADAGLALRDGNELKLIYPQETAPPERFENLPFDYFYLQPMDGPDREAHSRQVVDYCKGHPKWRPSIQTYKLLEIR